MLHYDQIQPRLAPFKIPDLAGQRLKRMKALPAKAAFVGRTLLNFDDKDKSLSEMDWQKRNAVVAEARAALPKLGTRDTRLLLAALFPRLVDTVEAAWKFFARLPYTLGSARRAFRAPSDHAALGWKRYDWLQSLIHVLNDYDPDAEWCATWAAYLSGYGGDALGILLAAAIDAGDEQVRTILEESASGQHDVGGMGRHVTRALLLCERPEAWAFVEKLLLAAQRQEGLRQVILETIDETHPDAFRRMLRLILDKNLVRFASVVRAIDVWFGLQWETLTPAVLKRTVGQALQFLEDPAARDEALTNAAGETFHLALWGVAFDDAHAAIPLAAALHDDPNLERRFVAVHLLNELQLDAARGALPAFLADEDLRVACRAASGCVNAPELFDTFVALMGRMPAKHTTLPALVWPWGTTPVNRAAVADRLVGCLGKRPPVALLPHLPLMSGYGKRETIKLLKDQKKWDAATRDALLDLVGDRDNWVRKDALEVLGTGKMDEADAQRLEGLLTRKNSDLRRGVLGMLRRQPRKAAFASIDRLLSSKKPAQRAAGLDMLAQYAVEDVERDRCRRLALAYQEKYPAPTYEEQSSLETIRDAGVPRPTLDDALGLLDRAKLTKPVAPKMRKTSCLTKAAVECLAALDALVGEHAATPITVQRYDGPQEVLFGNTYHWGMPTPNMERAAEEDAASLPLAAVWRKWFAERPPKLRDKDGFELLRAFCWIHFGSDWWAQRQLNEAGKEWADTLAFLNNGQKLPTLKYAYQVANLLTWLIRLAPPEDAARFILDTTESAFSLVPASAHEKITASASYYNSTDWRSSYHGSTVNLWTGRLPSLFPILGDEWAGDDIARWWRLMHWRDQPIPGVPRLRPDLDSLVWAVTEGAATRADLFDQLLGPSNNFQDLQRLTARPQTADPAPHPVLDEPIRLCRERVIEVELARGENPTAASHAARALASMFGADMLFRLLAALGDRPFSVRGHSTGRAEVFTHMIQACYPTRDDTSELFASRAKEAKLDAGRVLRLGVVAPQWMPHVEHALGWAGLREAFWWIMAHMGMYNGNAALACDDGMTPGLDLQRRWELLVRERSALTAADVGMGKYDVHWFRRVYETIGRKRWDMLLEAMRVPHAGSPLKRVAYAAEVILGRAKKADLVTRIREKFARESLRLLGLLPMTRGPKGEADLQGRYRVFMEYRRYARALSPMGREGALNDLATGLANLAQTADFPDPIRMEWALEAKEIADLAAGPVSVKSGDVVVELRIVDQKPEVGVRRGERPLKAVPPDVRTQPKVAALLARQGEIRRQASRVKQSLEAMMVRADTFAGRELKQLLVHPLLRPLLRQLVIVGEGAFGYPTEDGAGLIDHAGKRSAVRPDEVLRIAHPHDLFSKGDWAEWQAECFRSERVQPFKQVFRELYVVTAQERADGAASSRYASQQVNPSQANALWGGRGWNTKDEVTKTSHQLGIVAEVSFRHGHGTPAEVAGLTLDAIRFRQRGEWRPMPLAEVPPILFSEVMRDCDLVVSVAHVGGVDPEASASTVQMREALVRETCAVLKIANYEIKGTHILINGKLGKYSMHLGSGVVHRMPGGSLCIVPVQAQARGRLFLPFADDDPRTAEIVSKVLLLAKDHEIQDPTILEQLR